MTVAGRRLDPDRTRPAIAPAGPPVVQRLAEQVDRRWVVGGALAWLAVLVTVAAIEPAPADPEAVPAGLEAALLNVVVLAMAATAVGLAMRRRGAFVASLAASVLLLGMSLACPATGHHELAAWWFGELALVSSLVAASVVGLRRAPRV